MNILITGRKLIVVLFVLFFSSSIFGQRNKKLETTISASTSINYYPSIAPYSYLSSLAIDDDDLMLHFITEDSGTFVIDDNAPLFIEQKNESEFPSQIFGIGGSVQIAKGKSHFHEISLTKFAFSKSSRKITWTYVDSLNNMEFIHSGYKQNTAAIAVRYELGKYFRNKKSAKLRFGISGSIEPSLYILRRTSMSSTQYSMKGSLFTVEAAVIPMLAANVSKKVSMEFKLIPNLLLADYGSIKENNPAVPRRLQGGERSYNLPEINLAFSVLLKYKIKEPKKRRSRS